MKIHFLLAALFLPSLALAQQSVKLSVAQYIERYQRIAVSEMERSGIPASIKLAQGIHESAYGNSGLAQEANNHFGIKCGSDWKGQTYSKWDDEAQESCFRVYGSGEESYIEHTAFLVNRKRYAFLFEYDRTDYKNWARGLRKAGYASDPKYPDKLIETIEKYNLHRFDTLSGTIAFDQPLIIRPTPTPAPPPPPRLDSTAIFVRPNRSPRRVKRRSFLFPQYKKGIFRQNEASYVVAQKGESVLGVATRFGIPYAKLLKFNDLEDGDVLMDYQFVYIQPKKGQYKGEPSTHKVSQDETMYELAQFYGLRLETLLELNLLQFGQEPMNGSVIQLVEKASSPPSLRPRNYTDRMPEEKSDSLNRIQPDKPKDDVQPVVNPLGDSSRINRRWEYTEDELTKRPINVQDTQTRTQPINPPRTNPQPRIDTASIFPPRPNPQPRVDTPVVVRPTPVPPRPNTQPRVDTPVVVRPTPVPPRPNPQPRVDTPIVVRPIPVPPKPNPSPKTTERIHVVQSGDSLSKIARQYNITVAAIKQANRLSSDNIRIGQKLIIP